MADPDRLCRTLSKSDLLGVALTFIGTALGFMLGGTFGALTCLGVGFFVLVFWHHAKPDKPESGGLALRPEKSFRPTDYSRVWSKLGHRFGKLNEASIAASHNQH